MAVGIICFSFPDDIPVLSGLPTALQQFYAGEVRPPLAVAVDLGWGATYPDRIVRPQVHASSYLAHAWPIEGENLVPEPGVWRAIYPDWLNQPIWRRPEISTPDLFPTSLVFFGWKGKYPDQIERPWLDVSSQPSWAYGEHSTLPIPERAWAPSFPATIDPLTSLHASLQQVFDLDEIPIPNPPSPELAWGPVYPDRALPAIGLRATLQHDWVLEPIFQPIPTLSWQGWYPPVAPGRPMPVSLQSYLGFQFRIIAPDIRQDWQAQLGQVIRPEVRPAGLDVLPPEVPVEPIVWLADRQDPPDRLPRPPWQPPGGLMPLGALITIAARRSWNPTYPDQVHSLSQLFSPTAVPILSAPVVLPGSEAGCTVLEDEFVLTPTLEPDFVLGSRFDDDFVLVPAMTGEEVC